MSGAAAHAAELRSIAEAPGGASLVGLWVSGIQRFIFDVPTDNAGLDVKGRSFFVELLPKVLAWRARRAAALGDEHEVRVAAGRATLLVPTAAVEKVRAALVAHTRMLRDATGDDLVVDVADRPVATGESLSDALRGLDERMGVAWLRRAEGEGEGFWAPHEPRPEGAVEAGFVSLGRKLRGAKPRVAAIAVADGDAVSEQDARWSRLLGLAVAVDVSIEKLPALPGSPRLLLGTAEGVLPMQRAPDEVASLPLAGTWIAEDDDGGPLDFGGLALRAKGDAKLGILRLDLDSLGKAFAEVTKGKRGDDALRDMLVLGEAVGLACGPVADGVTWDGEEPRPVQWILAGGDDLFLVGAWSEILDVSLWLRDAIVPRLRKVVTDLAGKAVADKVDLSGGIVVTDAGVPLAHLADQCEDEVLVAKDKRPTRTGQAEKGAISWGGVAMGWADWRLVVDLGKQLGDAIERGEVPRSILRRLEGIHTLWHRARRALDTGKAVEAAESSKRQWLWAYELGRARAGLEGRAGAALMDRLSRLALEDLDTATGKSTERPAAAWLGIVAEIAHRRTRARVEERE